LSKDALKRKGWADPPSGHRQHTSFDKLRTDGCWLVAGGWWLVAGGWWLVAGGWWLVAGGWWLVKYTMAKGTNAK